jgi:hypothetical protein
MAYTKKVTKVTKYKKRSPASKPSGSIVALTKKVNAMAAAQRGTLTKCMYQQAATNLIMGNVAGNYIDIIPLNKFTTWSRIFGTDADDEQGKKCIIRNTNLQWNITTQEPDGIGFSVFCVSLKKTASDIITSAGDLSGLTAGTHYVGNGSKVLLNMNYFNLHYVKRFVQGSENVYRPVLGSAAPGVQSVPSETASLQKTGKISLPYGKYGMAVTNPSGDWKAGGHPKADTQNYFMLFFSDNVTVDGQNPFLSYNAVHSVVVSA